MNGGGVVGSLHLDVVVTAPRLPAPDEILMGETVSLVCGGKGGNQAVAASRHGAPTTMVGRVGGDIFAASLIENLREAGVDTSLIQRDKEAMSGLSVAVVGADGEYGAVVVSSANRALGSDGFVFPEGARVLVMQNEVPEAVNRAVAAEARESGATVVLNAAPMRPMAPETMRLVDLLIVNRIEAEGLFAMPIRTAEDAREAAERAGAGIAGEVIVTLGSDGLVHRDRRGEGATPCSPPGAGRFRSRRGRRVRGRALCPHGGARCDGRCHCLRPVRSRPVRVDPSCGARDFVRWRGIKSPR